MKNYKEKFAGKKITVMGLGLLGRGVGYTKFLAECGADIVVTDLKSEKELKKSVDEIKNWELRIKSKRKIKFVLGKHRLEDFKDKDMVIKNPDVRESSIYIKEAKKNKIPVVMDASLFAEYAKGVNIIGITGTRGKTMTTMLIYEILKYAEKKLKTKVYLGGNIRGGSTLPLLKDVKEGDTVVLELDSWQLGGFGEIGISPHISVFTSFMPDHLNYYTSTGLSTSGAMKKYFADKENIFKYQNKNDYLVVSKDVKKIISKNIKSKVITANKEKVKNFDFIVPGDHQRVNLACAYEVAKILDISLDDIKKAVKNFKGVEGRLQFVKTWNGIKIYNDNNATTPSATVAGLSSLGQDKNIILIAGGNSKNLETENLAHMIQKTCKAVVLLLGTGTEELIASMENISNIQGKIYMENTLKKAVNQATKLAKRGDIILFSPGFSSFLQWNNEYERNDEFLKIIKNLK